MASTTKPFPGQFAETDGGLRLGDWEYLRNAIYYQNSSISTYGISTAGTTQATATQLGAVFNQIDTSSAGQGVNLPLSTGKHNTPCQNVVIVNNTANAVQVYGAQSSTDTINGVAGSTGVTQAANSTVEYSSAKGGAWFSQSGISGGTIVNPTITGATINTSTANDLINTDTKNVTATTTAISTTTLVPVTGLSIALTTSGTYSILAKLPVTCTGAQGLALGLGTSNSLTLTSLNLTGTFLTASAVATANTTSTTLGVAIGSSTTVTLAELAGVAVVATGGTLLVEMAQNSSGATTTSVLANGFLQVTRIS